MRLLSIVSPILLASCAALPHGGVIKPSVPQAPVPAAGARQIIIFIPQNDQAAGAWIQLLDRHPRLRMVLALSPRFRRLAQDPELKSRIIAWQESGRLELALQIPNAPLLPLLINTDAARNALPPHSFLPDPPFSYPDDAAQIIALSKADFARIWKTTPRGIVLPYGAASPDLLKLLPRVGMEWAVAALGAPSFEGAYHAGSLRILDATPLSESSRFRVRVWDEHWAGSSALSLHKLAQWSGDLERQRITTVLPEDPELPVQNLSQAAGWGGRTWTTADWSPWIGTPSKNAIWEWLRRTRLALERYKDSGWASVKRLDAAFEQLYTAENANFFSGATEQPGAIAEEREHEFKATLAMVYRLIGQAPPDELFSGLEPSPGILIQASSPTVTWTTWPDGTGNLTITDPANDDHGDGRLLYPAGATWAPGAFDLRQFEVRVATNSLEFVLTLGTVTGTSLGSGKTPGPLMDVYMDINQQPNIGTLTLLRGRGAMAAPVDAWEYCLCLFDTQAQFYRTRGNDSYELVATFPLTVGGNGIRASVPRTLLRGSPQHWGYQVLVMSYDTGSSETDPRPWVPPASQGTSQLPIFDLLDPPDISQAQLLNDIESARRSDIPFIRLLSK